MNLIKELMALNEADDNSPAWYVVNNKDDAISAGPFKDKPTSSTLQQYQWYIKNPNGYSVEFGIVDPSFTEFDKFKEADQA